MFKVGIISLVTLFSSLAIAANEFTQQDAAVVSTLSAAAQMVMRKAVADSNYFLTTQLVDSPVVYSALTTPDVERIIRTVEKSPLTRFGIGTVGGSELVISYDKANVEIRSGVKNARVAFEELRQPGVISNGTNFSASPVENALTAKPQIETKTIYPRTVPSEQLRTQLNQLAADGTTVTEVKFRGFFPRAVGKAAGILQVIFISGATANSVRAGYQAYKAFNNPQMKWAPQECSSGCSANWVQWLYNSSDAVFFKFYADQPAQK